MAQAMLDVSATSGSAAIAGMRLFPDGTGVLAGGGKLWTTGNGGLTWGADRDLATNVWTFSPVNASEWWAWTSIGLEHVREAGAVDDLVMLGTALTDLRATADAIWGESDSDMGRWLALPLAGGKPQLLKASVSFWPLSRTTMVAQMPDASQSGSFGTGLSLSSDGGQTWSRIDGLSSTDSNPWGGCVADETHAWFEKGGSFSLFDGNHAELIFTSKDANTSMQSLFCDASRWWLLGESGPEVLSDGTVAEQTVPLEWDSGQIDSVRSSSGTGAAVSPSAAWILLWDGRLLHYLDDSVYGAYQGQAVLGTAPASGKTTPNNHPPVLDQITGEAHYNYDVDGNYMGGTVSLFTNATDQDGDNVTITWSLQVWSGGPTLTSTTGRTTSVILDGFASGQAIATASDGKGGTDTTSFQFGPPPQP